MYYCVHINIFVCNPQKDTTKIVCFYVARPYLWWSCFKTSKWSPITVGIRSRVVCRDGNASQLGWWVSMLCSCMKLRSYWVLWQDEFWFTPGLNFKALHVAKSYQKGKMGHLNKNHQMEVSTILLPMVPILSFLWLWCILFLLGGIHPNPKKDRHGFLRKQLHPLPFNWENAKKQMDCWKKSCYFRHYHVKLLLGV